MSDHDSTLDYDENDLIDSPMSKLKFSFIDYLIVTGHWKW